MKIGTCIRGSHIEEDLNAAISLGIDSGVTISGIGLYCNPMQNESAKRVQYRFLPTCMGNDVFGSAK